MKILILFVLGVDESGQLGAMLKVVERHYVGDSLPAIISKNKWNSWHTFLKILPIKKKLDGWKIAEYVMDFNFSQYFPIHHELHNCVTFQQKCHFNDFHVDYLFEAFHSV